jgi:DNA polymerase I-like protein with 3'-5' exonuclease and polymerase domains
MVQAITLLESLNDLVDLLPEIKTQKIISIDTENAGGVDQLLPSFRPLLFQIGFNGRVYMVDLRKTDVGCLKNVLEDEKVMKIIQNGKYDWKTLFKFYNINIKNMFDTMLAEQILTSGMNDRGGAGLKALALKYADVVLDKDVTSSFFDMGDEPFTKEQIDYAAKDVLVLPKIYKEQKELLSEYGMLRVAELEFALIETVAVMEMNGFKLNTPQWRVTLEDVTRKLFRLSTELHMLLPNPPPPPPPVIRIRKDGAPFKNNAAPKPPPILNLESPQQNAWAFKEIGVDLEAVSKVSKQGVTDVDNVKYALHVYKDDPVKVKALSTFAEYKSYGQIKKTFGESLIAQINPVTGRLHSTFNQLGADSGRFSSSDPNLQNIQKKSKEGEALRKAFVPEDGNVLVIADYSQVELRLAAEFSDDEVMLKLLNTPEGDIHRLTASAMYNLEYDKVTSEERRQAKTLNFGIIYGMTKGPLSQRLGCSEAEAGALLLTYVRTYSTMIDYVTNLGDDAVIEGYADTALGRRRWFPGVDRTDPERRRKIAAMKRIGRNHKIQGTSADMTKLAMLYLHRVLYKPEYCAKLVNTVHDELCVECPKENAEAVKKIVEEKMIKAGQVFLKKVPVMVDVKINTTWWKD